MKVRTASQPFRSCAATLSRTSFVCERNAYNEGISTAGLNLPSAHKTISVMLISDTPTLQWVLFLMIVNMNSINLIKTPTAHLTSEDTGGASRTGHTCRSRLAR